MQTDTTPLALQLREALIDLVTETGPRRMAPPLLHLGIPGGRQRILADDPGYDAGLRAEVVTQVLDQCPFDPVPWLTRNGDLSPGDLDYAWLAAVTEAFGRYAVPLPGFFVMTRRGWFNLLDDEDPVWCRVRPRRGGRIKGSSPGVYRLVGMHEVPVFEQGFAEGF